MIGRTMIRGMDNEMGHPVPVRTLFTAINRADKNLVKQLIEEGIDVNAGRDSTDYGVHPLPYLVSSIISIPHSYNNKKREISLNNRLDILNTLISNGSYYNEEGKDLINLVLKTIKWQSIIKWNSDKFIYEFDIVFRTLKLLLDRQFDPNLIEEDSGKIPMHYLFEIFGGSDVNYEAKEIFKLFIENGARIVPIVDRDGKTPLDYGSQQIKDMLLMYYSEK